MCLSKKLHVWLEKLNNVSFPEKEEFNSKLKMKVITNTNKEASKNYSCQNSLGRLRKKKLGEHLDLNFLSKKLFLHYKFEKLVEMVAEKDFQKCIGEKKKVIMNKSICAVLLRLDVSKISMCFSVIT